jgi:hypothetical protein
MGVANRFSPIPAKANNSIDGKMGSRYIPYNPAQAKQLYEITKVV